MRRTLVLACAVGALLAGPTAAYAVNVPLYPEPGARFDTTDTEEFTVTRNRDDPSWSLVLAAGDGGSGGEVGFHFPAEEGTDSVELDIGWLATKFGKLGLYSWWVCGYDLATHEVLPGTCTPPRPFHVKFRLSTLVRGDAITDAKTVFEAMIGASDSGVDPRCHRVSRTKQTCRVSAYLGDTAFYGRVTMWSKRPRGVRTYDLTRYSATLRIYDEYCHLVNKRPLTECDKPYKRRSGWTADLYQ